MAQDQAVENVDPDEAMAVGLLVLSDATLPQAADRSGMTLLELEKVVESAELAADMDVDPDRDVTSSIDELLDG